MASDESTPLLSATFLTVEAEEMARDLAKCWGWIFFAGMVDLAAGIFALLCPVVATELAYIFATAALFVAGVIHAFGLCFAEKGHRLPSFLVGVSQIVLAAILQFYPLAGLSTFTIFIAVLFILEGSFRVGLAVQNRDMPGWGATLANGISAIILSVVIIAAMPMSAFYTIGILLGVNLVTLGMCRVVISCHGRSIANAQIDAAPTENLLV